MLIGREAELERVERAMDIARAGGSDVLVVRGIGTTALLVAAIERAGDMTLVRTRGLEGEAQLPFAGLAELCEPVVALRDRLPAAQASALAGALELEPAAPQARLAVGTALLGLLSLAAEERPVLCVAEEVQWLDEPSLEALRFAARRLGADGVAVLLAHRSDSADVAPGFEELEPGPPAPERALDEGARTQLAHGEYLRAAGAIPRGATGDAAELTAHELRVAQLVAQGLTNRETAGALFVTAKTVEHHLRNVFRKLGVKRRTELARLMAAR